MSNAKTINSIPYHLPMVDENNNISQAWLPVFSRQLIPAVNDLINAGLPSNGSGGNTTTTVNTADNLARILGGSPDVPRQNQNLVSFLMADVPIQTPVVSSGGSVIGFGGLNCGDSGSVSATSAGFNCGGSI